MRLCSLYAIAAFADTLFFAALIALLLITYVSMALRFYADMSLFRCFSSHVRTVITGVGSHNHCYYAYIAFHCRLIRRRRWYAAAMIALSSSPRHATRVSYARRHAATPLFGLMLLMIFADCCLSLPLAAIALLRYI